MPCADNVCIHSVVVDPQFRRKGIGSRIVRDYVSYLRKLAQFRVVTLLAKGHLVKFYESCGFVLVGVSPVVHGADKWFELKADVC